MYNFLVFSTASVFFAYVSLRMLFPMLKSRLHPLKGLSALPVFFLCFLVIWVIDRYLFRKMNRRTANAAIIGLIALNAALQIICLNYLKVRPSWDFGAIMTAAGDIASGHAIRNWGYFQEYPFNIYTAVLVGTYQYLAGGSPSAPYTLNILSVISSIIGACLLVYRLYGHKSAVLAAFFLLGMTPLYMNIPIVYTDTLSMPFAVWTVYLWTFIRNGHKNTILYCILIGLSAAAGYLIKPVAAAGLAAFAVDFLMNRGKYRQRAFLKHLAAALPLAAALITFVVSIFAFRAYVSWKGFDSRIDSNKSLPYTHWLMMGMNTIAAEGGTSSGYGGFSAADLKFSRTYPTTMAKKIAEIGMIKTRLRHFGITGYGKFLLKKIEWTWTDGTYFVPVKLSRLPIKRTILHKFVLFSNGKSNKLYLIFTQFIQTAMLAMILLGCLSALKNSCSKASKSRNADALLSLRTDAYRLMTLMCLGLMFFLLFWETRSRYLIFMIPIFVVMTVNGLILAFRGLDKAAAYVRFYLLH